MPMHKSNRQLMRKRFNPIPVQQLRLANSETIGYCLRNDIASFSITFNPASYTYITKITYKNIEDIEKESFRFINRVSVSGIRY